MWVKPKSVLQSGLANLYGSSAASLSTPQNQQVDRNNRTAVKPGTDYPGLFLLEHVWSYTPTKFQDEQASFGCRLVCRVLGGGKLWRSEAIDMKC